MSYRLLPYLLVLLISGCAKEENYCFKSMGDIVVETQFPGIFDEVEIIGFVDVEIIHSTEHKVEVEYGGNVIEGIVAKREGARLIIDEQINCKWQRDLELRPLVRIYLPHLSYLLTHSSADLFAPSVISDTVTVEIFDAAGDLSLGVLCNKVEVFNHAGAKETWIYGVSNVAEFYSASNSLFDATGLFTGQILMNNSGLGDMKIRCTGDVYYQIHGAGDVYINRGATPLPGENTGNGMLFYY